MTLREHFGDIVTSASHLVLLLVAIQINEPIGWMVSLGLIGIISLVAWASSYKRCRYISDTPTSRIASAAQGYVELYGRTAADGLIYSPYGNSPCVWYRYQVHERQGNKWQVVGSGQSDHMIEISDGTGICFIDPDDAEVISPDKKVTKEGQYRYTEELLRGYYVYALGEFSTIGGANTHLNLKSDVTALLAEWKRKPQELLAKFDLDGNGEIDLREWNLARRAATREIEKQHREIRAKDGVHVMRAPRTRGRPFLLSNLSPQKLRNIYYRWGLVHICIVFISTFGVLWFWQGHHILELFT